jgi:hypothetical protein
LKRHEKIKTIRAIRGNQNFEKLAKQSISVPKNEIDKREAEYQRAKKSAKKRKGAA